MLDRDADGLDASQLSAELKNAGLPRLPRLFALSHAVPSATLPSGGSPDLDGLIAGPLQLSSFERAFAPHLHSLRLRAPAVRANPTGRNLSLLLIEDDSANQRVALAYLKRAGHQVEIAGDGLTGVGMHAKGRYDAVLMDVQLPHLDGLHATRMIRSSGARNDVPIIALTANAMKGDAEVCMAVGMDAYFPKPVDWDRLLALLALIANGEHRRGLRSMRTA